MSKKTEEEAVMWQRSTTVDELLPYVTYLYLDGSNSALKKNTQYRELKNWEKSVMYKLQSPKPKKASE